MIPYRRLVVVTAALVSVSFSSAAIAGSFPIPFEIQDAHRNGGAGCDGLTDYTEGNYDAVTLSFQISFDCVTPPYREDGGMRVLLFEDGQVITRWYIGMSRILVSGFVDNDGNVLGGDFAWSGIIPELGILTPTLLMFGSLLDVVYVPDDEPISPTPNPKGFSYQGLYTLLGINWTIDAFSDLGPYIQWDANGSSDFPGCDDSVIGNCEAFSTSVDLGGNFTESTLTFYDRRTLIPEPGTLALFGIGLFGMGLSRRKKV